MILLKTLGGFKRVSGADSEIVLNVPLFQKWIFKCSSNNWTAFYVNILYFSVNICIFIYIIGTDGKLETPIDIDI